MVKSILIIIYTLWSIRMVNASELSNNNNSTDNPRMFHDFHEAVTLAKNGKNIIAQSLNDYGGCFALDISVRNINCSKLTFLRVIQYLSHVEWALKLDWTDCKPLSDPKELNHEPKEGLDSDVGYHFLEFNSTENIDHNRVWLSDYVLELGITPEMILKVLGGEEDYPLPTPID